VKEQGWKLSTRGQKAKNHAHQRPSEKQVIREWSLLVNAKMNKAAKLVVETVFKILVGGGNKF